MKNLVKIPLLIVSFFTISIITSCGSGSPDNEVESLKKEKDSLRNLKTEVSEQLAKIEEQLKVLDTNANLHIPVVSIMSPKSGLFRHYFNVQGVVETDKNAQINADVAAKILQMKVKEGDHVKKGQSLMQLDSRVLLNNIEELKTQIELANTVYEKQKSLWDQNIGSEVQFLEAKTNKESMEAKLQTAYSQLDYYNIKAPFDGVVDEIFPKVGEMASPGIPLVRVLNLDKVYLKADISENYLSKISVGDTAVINFPSVDLNMVSTVSRMGNFINPNNRTFKIRFELENENHILIPNLLASIQILDYTSDSKRYIIPTKLIQETPQGDEFIFTLKENGIPKAHKIMIESGISYHGEIEVISGIEEDDKVIVKGARGIKDGEVVSIVD